MKQIQLKNLKKSYASTQIIKGIDLDIDDKEFVVLVGPSGCGKSTTLRMIAGLEDITDGEVLIKDKKMNHVSARERDVAMVFQDYALYPHMTVFGNMAFSLELKNVPKDEINRRVKEAADMLDLTPYLDRKPANLSGGQRQRVAMGRAIVKKSNVFLYDEPLSNLDAKLRSKMRSEIKKFHIKAGTTSVYVTHDQLEAMTLADKLVVMNGGVIEQMGTPMEVFAHPVSTFVATFIGSPQMNIIEMNVKKEGGATILCDGTKQVRFPLPESKKELVKKEGKIILGIRPSDIFISNDQDGISPDWKVDAIVEMVELLGKNAYLTFRVGEHEVVGEVMGTNVPKIGDKVKVSFNLFYIHLFDAETKRNLESRSNT